MAEWETVQGPALDNLVDGIESAEGLVGGRLVWEAMTEVGTFVEVYTQHRRVAVRAPVLEWDRMDWALALMAGYLLYL